MKKLANTLKRLIKRMQAEIRLREAVRKADAAHEMDGTRYYVMPSTAQGKLLIMNRLSFRKLKRKHYISQSCSMNDVERISFYFSADKLGDTIHPLLREKGHKRFISWYLASKKSKND